MPRDEEQVTLTITMSQDAAILWLRANGLYSHRRRALEAMAGWSQDRATRAMVDVKNQVRQAILHALPDAALPPIRKDPHAS